MSRREAETTTKSKIFQADRKYARPKVTSLITSSKMKM